MSTRQITDALGLERALASECFLLFKHSLICPVSERAFRAYEAFLEERPNTPTGWVDVIGSRPLAREITAVTGVQHESPQAFVIRNGRVAWNASHGAITRDALRAALESAQV